MPKVPSTKRWVQGKEAMDIIEGCDVDGVHSPACQEAPMRHLKERCIPHEAGFSHQSLLMEMMQS